MGDALSIIHEALDGDMFEKVSCASKAKQAWEIRQKAHQGIDKVKKIGLQRIHS